MTQPNVDFRSELAGQATTLRSLAARLVHRDDAEDVAQEAMVTALSTPTSPRNIRPWMRQVLRNTARATTRGRVRRQAREVFAGAPEGALPLEEAAMHGQMAAAVRDALVDLDPPYRMVLEARFYEHRTAADIARSEGCPAGTVRWRVQEGLRRMRSKLDDRFEGRDAWRGSMAAFAAMPWAPPPSPPPGASTMINTSFSKLALGALALTAVGGVALASSAQSPEPVAREDAPAPVLAAATAASADSPALTATRHAEPTPRAPLAAATPPRPSHAVPPTQPAEDVPCQTCAEDNMPSFDVVAACVEEHPVSATGRIDINVKLGRNGDGTVVEEAAVRSHDDADAALVGCLEDGLVASAATVPDGAEPLSEMNLVLLPQTAAVTATAEHATPLEYASGERWPARSEGEEPATRTVIECAEFDCPFSERARTTLEQLVDEYETVEVQWMHNPLPAHAGAMVAARASVAAQSQGAFWGMHDLLFDHPERRTDAEMLEFAKELGLDAVRFERDFHDPATLEEIETQRQSCLAAGAQGTPAFFVDDTVVVGAQPIDVFRDLLD